MNHKQKMKKSHVVVFFLIIWLILIGIELIYWSNIYIKRFYSYRYLMKTVDVFTSTPLNVSIGDQNYYEDKILISSDLSNFNKTFENDTLDLDELKNVTKKPDTFKTDHNNPSAVQPINVLGIQDIKQSEYNIFFVETKCATEKTAAIYNKTKGLLLDVRQSCAIESTALANSDKKVYVLYSCPLGDYLHESSPEHARQLLKYANVYFVSLNMSQVLSGSPVQELHELNKVENSSYPLEHTSDVLRYTLLWKFGGIYSDLDVVTIRSFGELGSNWAGSQEDEVIASGVMNFSPIGEGHAMVGAALRRMRRRFDGNVWGANGPAIITATALRWCHVATIKQARENCHANFTVLESNILYPINYPYYKQLFDEKVGPEVVKKLKTSAYSVHMWNKLSYENVVNVGSTQAYSLLAKEYCPKVYRHVSGRMF